MLVVLLEWIILIGWKYASIFVNDLIEKFHIIWKMILCIYSFIYFFVRGGGVGWSFFSLQKSSFLPQDLTMTKVNCVLYPFHINPKVQSQRHFYDNAAWCKHPKTALCHKSRIHYMRSATTSRGVLEAYSSQKPNFETVLLSVWKGAPNNAEGKAIRCTPFLTPHLTPKLLKCGDPKLGVKAKWSTPERSDSETD